MLFKLEIPPGLYANGTDYQTMGRWRQSNLVRWRSGFMQPINGWQLFNDFQLEGRVSDIHQYRDGENRRAAIGTHTHLYAVRPDGEFIDITPDGYVEGRPDSGNVFGYGIGLYGVDMYGISTPESGAILPGTTWTLDNFGGFLVACANTDGRLYFWDGLTPEAEVMPNAPINCKGVIVTEERFVVALGAEGNNALVKWSDQEDFTVWSPAPTNQAGDYTLQTNGEILQALRVRGQTLLLTTSDAHSMTYRGQPFVYGFERVGTGCGLISPQAAVATDAFAIWMGRTGFYIYDGFVKPLPCDVLDAIYSNINLSQERKISAWANMEYGEVWFHYPSAESNECDSYITWNWRENTWALGKMDRLCGSNESVYSKPILASSQGLLYSHEIGFNFDGAVPFAETGPFEVDVGEAVFMARHLYPDERTQGDVQAIFKTRFYPNGPEKVAGPYIMSAPTSVRFTGRQVVMRVEGVRQTDWRVGIPRLEVVARGTR